MELFSAYIHELKLSIDRGIKDHSIVAKIHSFAMQIKLDDTNLFAYSSKILEIYDLSNSPQLLSKGQQKRQSTSNGSDLQIDPLGLKIKVIVLIMASQITKYFYYSIGMELSQDFMKEILEIMIIISRIFLDYGGEFCSHVSNIYHLCDGLYDIFQLHLPKKLLLFHYVNTMDLTRLKIGTGEVNVRQFEEKLQLFSQSAFAVEDALQIQYVDHIAMELLLKLLKQGKGDCISKIKQLISKDAAASIDHIVSFNAGYAESKSLLSNQFYDLYLAITREGIETIEEMNLKNFFSQNSNFQNHQFFDVVAMTGEPILLQVWLNVYNQSNRSEIKRNDTIATAYRCFTYLIDCCFKDKHSLDQIAKMSRLSKAVLLTLLSEKKEDSEGTLNVLKRIVKVFTQIVLTLKSSSPEIKDFSDKLVLVCTKHGYSEMLKSVYSLTLYHQLLNHTPNQSTFNKFLKSNALDKSSQMFKALKLGYEMQINGGLSMDKLKENKELFFKSPHLGILFAPKLSKSIILQFQIDEFLTFQNKFEYYYAILKEVTDSRDPNLNKIIDHLQKVLILVEHYQLGSSDFGAMIKIKWMLLDLIKRGEKVEGEIIKKMAMVTLYLHIISSDIDELKNKNQGLILNRYSKITKMLSAFSQKQGKVTDEMLLIGKVIFTRTIQRMKELYELKEPISESGEVRFLETLYKLVFHSEADERNRLYLQFINFQIHCLTDSVDETQISLQQNSSTLKMYCQSPFIKKSLKLKILRKLLKDNISAQNQLVSLSDFKQLLSLTENESEKAIYAQQIIRNYGQVGKSMLLLLSYKNPQSWDCLIEQKDME